MTGVSSGGCFRGAFFRVGILGRSVANGWLGSQIREGVAGSFFGEGPLDFARAGFTESLFMGGIYGLIIGVGLVAQENPFRFPSRRGFQIWCVIILGGASERVGRVRWLGLAISLVAWKGFRGRLFTDCAFRLLFCAGFRGGLFKKSKFGAELREGLVRVGRFVGCLEGVPGKGIYDFKLGMENLDEAIKIGFCVLEHREALARFGHFERRLEGVSGEDRERLVMVNHCVGCLEGVQGAVFYDYKLGKEHREGSVKIGYLVLEHRERFVRVGHSERCFDGVFGDAFLGFLTSGRGFGKGWLGWAF